MPLKLLIQNNVFKKSVTKDPQVISLPGPHAVHFLTTRWHHWLTEFNPQQDPYPTLVATETQHLWPLRIHRFTFFSFMGLRVKG